MTVMKPRAFKGGKVPSFYPGMNAELSEDVQNVNEAVQQISIQSMIHDLIPLLSTLEKYGEQNCNLPTIISGETVQSGQAITAFETNVRHESAGKYLGSVMANVDEGIIEPVVEVLYMLEMMKPGKNDTQGPYVVNATGFSSFQAKQLLTQGLQLTMSIIMQHPELMKYMKVREHLEKLYDTLDADPNEFLKTERELADEEANQTQQMLGSIAQMLGLAPEELAEVAGGGGNPQDLLKKISANLQEMNPEFSAKLIQAKAKAAESQTKQAEAREKMKMEGAQTQADIAKSQTEAAENVAETQNTRADTALKVQQLRINEQQPFDTMGYPV
jgi:hypothetical protein